MELLRTLQVIFGIGLVIFVHEAGHFIAARLCKVRVEVFSLGFGPRLFGWRRGTTLYQVAVIPVGGYVRMAGEMPDGSGRPPRGDELYSKSPGQRFFIYSGGVIMNVLFALIAFPLVFAAGVPIIQPIIGAPTPGMPAWRADLEPGSEVLTVAGEEMFDFEHIAMAVALADPGPIEFTVRRPGAATPETLLLEPEYDELNGLYRVGIGPGLDPQRRIFVVPDGAADLAGLREDDVLLGIEGGLTDLRPEEQFEVAMLSGAPFMVRVLRGEEQLTLEVEPQQVDVPGRLRFGFQPLQNQIKAVRPNDDLAALALTVGERVLSVNDAPIRDRADWLTALLASETAPVVTLEDADGKQRRVPFARALDKAAAIRAHRDLFLSFDPESSRVEVTEGQAVAAAGLLTGDRLRSMDGQEAQGWDALFELAQDHAKRSAPVTVGYERRDEQGVWRAGEVEVTPTAMALPSAGFAVKPATAIYRTTSAVAAIQEGFDASRRWLANTWLALKKMVMQRVSTKNMGGIITISNVSYSVASEGLAKLFFFLCVLSINLALLNVLPIPVLDGGHLFFILVEAIKGSPVSQRTLGYSQVVGMVVILTLMVYVTYNDVLRWF